jgi:tetratricopeptide (TPR) repeat protein
MEGRAMSWQWWVGIGVAAWILFCLVVWTVRSLLSPRRAVADAMRLARAGDVESAQMVLRIALDRTPRYGESGGLADADRFLLELALSELRNDPVVFGRNFRPPERPPRQPPPGGPTEHRLARLRGAIAEAMRRAQFGQPEEGARILQEAINDPPSADRIDRPGESAALCFQALVLLSDLVRKSSRDARRELDLLNEAVPLLPYAPRTPAGLPDHVGNMAYLLHMNRGVAATRLGLFTESAAAYGEALEAAREPGTRCKCLAYRALDLLKQNDPARTADAYAVLDQFDREAAGSAVGQELHALNKLGRAVQCLDRQNLAGARTALEEAMRLGPAPRWTPRALDMLRQPHPDTAAVRRLLLQQDGPGGGQAAPASPAGTLRPLPEDI